MGLPQLDCVILIAAANSIPPWLTPAQKRKLTWKADQAKSAWPEIK